MQTFQYIENKYVPNVNLTTLGKTFDTLEEGHQQTIKANNALKTELAKLDLNEQDEWYRRQYAEKLDNIVKAGTLYGNSYYALDDVMNEVGNLAMDEGLRGRLESNKNYKQYRETIIKDNTLPQNYKDYYLETNPYHYEDKYDENGKTIIGNIWQPNSSPTKVEDLSATIVKGIKLAAVESGQGTTTRWLDANGQITTDPSQAFDGEVFDTTTNSWKRLPKEKILKSIHALIDADPSLQASLKQDYDVGLWEHNKAVKNNSNPDEPIIDDMTLPDGKILTQDEWLEKRLDPVADVASFYENNSQTTYGDGLKTYKAAMNAIAQAEQQQADELTGGSSNASSVLGADAMSHGNPITVDYDAASKWQEDIQEGVGVLNDYFKQCFGRSMNVDMSFASDIGWNNTINKIVTQKQKQGATAEQIANIKQRLYNAKDQTQAAAERLNQVRNNLNNKDDKDAFDFTNRIKNGASYQKTNKWDRQYASKVNSIWGNAEYVGFQFDNDAEADAYLQEVSGGKTDGWRNLGYVKHNTGNGIVVVLPSSKRRLIAQAVRAYDATDPRFLGSIRSRPMVALDANFNNAMKYTQPMNPYGFQVSPEEIMSRNLTQLVNFVNDVEKKSNQATQKIVPKKITYQTSLLNGQTANQYAINRAFDNGQIDTTTYNAKMKKEQDAFENAIVNHGWSQTRMFATDKDGHILSEVKNSKDREEKGKYIRDAVASGKGKASFVSDPVYGTGTIITVPGRNTNGVISDNYEYNYFIPGLVVGDIDRRLAVDDHTVASNNVQINNNIGGSQTILSSNKFPCSKTQRITYNQNGTTTFKGFDTTVQLNMKNSADVIYMASQLNEIYNALNAGTINKNDSVKMTNLDNLLQQYATQYGTILNIHPNVIYRKLRTDLNY